MRYIPFCTKISSHSIDYLMRKLQEPDAPRSVGIVSPGGEFSFFSTIGPKIERRGLTMIAGDVRSSAVILYLLGHHRLACPDATFFFHEVYAMISGIGALTIAEVEHIREQEELMKSREDQETVERWYSQMRSAQNWYLRFMAEKTQLSTSVFLDLMRSNATLDAHEAKRLGIVTNIISLDELQQR